jgi:hypothetical protein
MVTGWIIIQKGPLFIAYSPWKAVSDLGKLANAFGHTTTCSYTAAPQIRENERQARI